MLKAYLILASLILSFVNCNEQQFWPEIPHVQELFGDLTFPFINKVDDIVHTAMDDSDINPNGITLTKKRRR